MEEKARLMQLAGISWDDQRPVIQQTHHKYCLVNDLGLAINACLPRLNSSTIRVLIKIHFRTLTLFIK